jgi:hypothetical protein
MAGIKLVYWHFAQYGGGVTREKNHNKKQNQIKVINTTADTTFNKRKEMNLD